jgi:hypothetical protein
MLGCSGSNPPPADNQPTDAVSEGGGGGDGGSCMDTPAGDGGNCYRQTRCDMQPFCPNLVTNSAMAPNFVITQIDLTRPASLASTSPVGRLLNTAIVGGTAFWGISLNITSATAGTIRTGALQQGPMPGLGTGFYNSTFHYFNGMAPMPGAATRWDPVMGNIMLMGETFSSDTIASMTIPLYNDADHSLLAELPLRNAHMRNVTLTSMRNCIGLANPAFNSCLSNNRWNTTDPTTMMPAGILEGDMTVEDARSVTIPSLSTNLCSVIAGADCTMVTDPTMWQNPPDTMVNGTTNNAWHISGAFTAVAATIQ